MRRMLVLLALLWVPLVWDCFGGELPPPIPRKDRPVADELYLRRIQKEHNNLVRVTTNPNGSVRGQRNDVVVYDNAGSLKFCVNDSSTGEGTTWRCSANALTAP